MVQNGTATPSEVGVNLEPRKDGEQTAVEIKQALTKPDKPTGTPGEGRPKNSKDSEKREERTFTSNWS